MSYNSQFVSALKEALNGLRTIHSVGEEWCSYIGQIPTGGVPYCGQEVTRETYSALWSYAQAQGLVKSESEWQSIASSQNGNVPFYSDGNGSSTFRMPSIKGYVKGASGQSEAGEYIAEGLPNITGNIGSNLVAHKGADLISGAFQPTVSGKAGTLSSATGNQPYFSLDIDASRSSAIYGNSSHVTPETSVVLFGVYAFGEVGNVDALDAGTLASALARVESNLNGVVRSVNGTTADPDGNVSINAFPSLNTDAVIELALGEWTATGNGLVIMEMHHNNWTNASLTLNGVMVGELNGYAPNATMYTIVKTGDRITMEQGSSSGSWRKFIPFN